MIINNYLIVGSYGSTNIWDDAILQVICKKLNRHKIRVLSWNPKETEKQYNVESAIHMPCGIRSFLSLKWLKTIRYIIKSDKVIVWWGWLFTDDYTIKSILIWFVQVFWCKFFRKKEIYLFANSVGPLNIKTWKILTKWSLNQCKKIILRDEISLKVVKQLWINEDKIFTFTDIVFDFDKAEEVIQKNKIIALNLRDWKNTNYTDMQKFIDFCLKQKYRILLIPMEKRDEIILKQFIKPFVSLIVPKNYNELLEVLSSCDTVIWMRLHFLIAGIISQCKVWGISYSSKVKWVLNQFKIPFITPSCELKELKSLLNNVKVVKNLDKQKKQIDEMFKIMDNW